ncbi:MAG: methyltransferase domain-containing protein [Ignavibacteria bacterium]|nr:methyltransferase domain-containing protein [Ignavibacteria bacterium]
MCVRVCQNISPAVMLHLSGIIRLDPRPGLKILDVATGTGCAARRIAARGAKVTGIDIGEELIKASKQHPGNTALMTDFRVGDADALPFVEGREVSIRTDQQCANYHTVPISADPRNLREISARSILR